MHTPTTRPRNFTRSIATCKPAFVYLCRDADDLARIRYGLTLSEVCCRQHVDKRVWIAQVLLDRGWFGSDVCKALRYTHSATLYDALKGA